jgi:hypothetical protein
MNHAMILKHEFIEYVPEVLQDGVVYVSIPFATVSHKCCCGCGRQVVTPLTPTDWSLSFDGQSISLHPSIGNWSFPCRSHYWIRQNRVTWAPSWTPEEIRAGRAQDLLAKERHFDRSTSSPAINPDGRRPAPTESTSKESLWQKVKNWFR